jgi:hypothetical protein
MAFNPLFPMRPALRLCPAEIAAANLACSDVPGCISSMQSLTAGPGSRSCADRQDAERTRC